MASSQQIRKALIAEGVNVIRVRKVSFADLARDYAYFVEVSDRGDAYRAAQASAVALSKQVGEIILIDPS